MAYTMYYIAYRYCITYCSICRALQNYTYPKLVLAHPYIRHSTLVC